MTWLSPTHLIRFTGLLILLSLVVQNLLPTGYMPRFNADKGFEITICQGADAQTIRVDGDMNPLPTSSSKPFDQPDHDNSSQQNICVFSLYSTVALMTILPFYTVEIPLIHRALTMPSLSSLHIAMVEKSYNAQAPPSQYLPLLLMT